MQQLIYVSSVRQCLQPQAIMQLVSRARRRNRLHGVTGILVSSPRHFLQLLEGEAADVDKIFADIRQDSRHRAVLQLGRRPVGHRFLPGEDMAFCRVNYEVSEASLGRVIAHMVAALDDQSLSEAVGRFARAEQLA